MADYFPLIARAVQALPEQSPELRAAVYERAREALIGQLRSLDPPLSEEEIADETVALDAAIAEIEAAYGPEPLDEGPEEPAAEPERWAAPEDAPEEWPGQETEPADQPVAGLPPQGGADERQFGSPEESYPGDEPQEPAPLQPAPKARLRLGSAAPRPESGGGLRMAIVVASIAVVIGAIAFVAFQLAEGDPEAPATPAPVAEAPRVDEEGKIAERIEPAPPAADEAAAPPDAAPATAPNGIAVTQRAILYEEDPVNPQGEPRAAGGGAVWMLDPPAGGSGDPSVRAVVEVPDAGLTMTMVMRRNLDATLPASHTIELSFTTTGRDGRTVRDIGLLQLKEEEVVRGAPIAGLPVPVQDNLFLIGLSNVAADTQRNRNLLTQRNWIDIPIRFSNGQRAIVSFEKGVSGEQAFARAFEAWDR
ncbi:MAG: histidine kinase [Salinarimonadaceae bacterium]|nr:MAG: histidine kinase [Salinarimonadaceae bacterium]